MELCFRAKFDKERQSEKIVEIMEDPYMVPTEPYEQKGFIHYTLFLRIIDFA